MDNKSKRIRVLKSLVLSITFVFTMCSWNKAYRDDKIPQSDSVKADVVRKEKKVYIGGEPLGIKVNTKGLLVIGVADIETEEGLKASPAIKAGIQIGDNILKVQNNEVKCSEEMSKVINNNKGNKIIIEFQHKGKNYKKVLTPVKSKLDDKYKVGMWVRDSSSGIGTLTFYDDETHRYGALGHGISDGDTGTMINVGDGKIMPSEIIAVKKSVEGTPGELRGIFSNGKEPLGNVKTNNICGIFGEYSGKVNLKKKFKEPMPIAYQNEIKEGKAYIYTTINGNAPKLYEIEIEKTIHQEEPNSKSMLIKVTDKRLLEQTGGIVQGMSGSPIIQNDKLIGAVTHVLVNKPNKGYGIYIEWMMKECEFLQNY